MHLYIIFPINKQKFASLFLTFYWRYFSNAQLKVNKINTKIYNYFVMKCIEIKKYPNIFRKCAIDKYIYLCQLFNYVN